MKAGEVKNEVAWDWMRPEAATIQNDSTLEEAVSRMRRLRIHHLIVMDGKKFLGLLDARDCAGIWDKDTKVGRIMRSDLVPVDEATEISRVVEMIIDRGVTALPLKRNHEVNGIITATDLLRLLEAHLSHHHEISEFLVKGKEFLARPIVQSLSRLLGEAGL